MRNDEPSFDTFKNAVKLHSSVLKIDAPQQVEGFSDGEFDSLANFLKAVYKTAMQAVSDEHSSGVFGSDGRFGKFALGLCAAAFSPRELVRLEFEEGKFEAFWKTKYKNINILIQNRAVQATRILMLASIVTNYQKQT